LPRISARHSQQIDQLPPALIGEVREITKKTGSDIVEFTHVGPVLAAR
jgi:hypothetical protein